MDGLAAIKKLVAPGQTVAVERGAVHPHILESLASADSPASCALCVVGTPLAAATAAATAGGPKLLVWAPAPAPVPINPSASVGSTYCGAGVPCGGDNGSGSVVTAAASLPQPPPTFGPAWAEVSLDLGDDPVFRHVRVWSRIFVLHVHAGAEPTVRQIHLGAAVQAQLPPGAGFATLSIEAPAMEFATAVAAATVILVTNATAAPASVYPGHVFSAILPYIVPEVTALAAELCPYSPYMLDMLAGAVCVVGADMTASTPQFLPTQVRAKMQEARPLAAAKRDGPALGVLQDQLRKNPLTPRRDHGVEVPRVVLTMIVRDESTLIQRCVRAAWPFVDAYCILDTGSVDDTHAQFEKVVAEGVAPKPGVYVFGSWRGFGASRSEALALGRAVHAPGAKWLLMVDADDIFNGAPGSWLPCKPGTAAHELSVRFGKDGTSATSRIQVFSRDHAWTYRGILHEYPFLPLDTPNAPPSTTPKARAMGPHLPPVFFIDARTEGYRSRNPTKYRDDALALEAALANPATEAMDRSRYTFYLAQSWRDAGDTPRALEIYKQVAVCNNTWSEERYVACMNIIELSPLTTPAELEALLPWVWVSLEASPLRREVVLLCMARARMAAVKPVMQLYAAALVVSTHASQHCLSSFVFGRVQAYDAAIWAAELGHVTAALNIKPVPNAVA